MGITSIKLFYLENRFFAGDLVNSVSLESNLGAQNSQSYGLPHSYSLTQGSQGGVE